MASQEALRAIGYLVALSAVLAAVGLTISHEHISDGARRTMTAALLVLAAAGLWVGESEERASSPTVFAR